MSLELRKRIAEKLIQMLEGDPDPRAPAAIEELQRQVQILESRIEERESEEVAGEGELKDGKPEPVVVGLKTLGLRAEQGR